MDDELELDDVELGEIIPVVPFASLNERFVDWV